MLKNYLRTAFRNLWRHRVFSFINIMGLTIGMAACFLIFMYIRFELSYDAFNSKANRIYRVVADIKTPTETIHSGGPAWAVAPNMKDAFPEVEAFVRVNHESMLIRRGEVKFQEDDVMYADSALFHVFDFTLLKGNAATVLREPLSVVLSEKAAKKYFGGAANALGKGLLLTGDAFPALVTGIMKDIPENSLVKADVVVSMSTLSRKFQPHLDEQWSSYNAWAFVLLKPGTSAQALETKLPAFLNQRNGDEMKKIQMFVTLFLEPLRDVYLRSTRDIAQTGNINNVYIFSVIAVFILLIACINFINLTTARSTERAKEVGIRKVAGAEKQQLMRQFIGESIILSLIAALLSTGIASLLIPLFNKLAGKTVSTGIFNHPADLLILLGAAIVIGLLAGLYPALVLAAFKPVIVLKGRFATGAKGILLRKGLVITQFTVSIALIIGTIVVYRQMNFMRNRDLGFSKEQIVVFNTYDDKGRDAFRNALTGMARVQSAALSSSVPGGGNFGAYSQVENNKGDLQIANLDLYFVDWDYIPLYKIRIVAGRAFSRAFGTDTTQAMVLNEAAVRMLGYPSPQQAIGKRFRQWGREGKIIGVVKDFHFKSLQSPIKPLSMRMEPKNCELVSAAISGQDVPATLAAIESKWKTHIPNRPFSYYFMDEFFDRQYRAEERFGRLFLNFAILAIFISCLGLLGLASYSTMQRTREIGIRKVMGASVSNIVHLLSKDFLLLVIIAFFMASPLAWLLMHNWLNDFAYRTNIQWWVYVLAGISALVIALATVSFQAVKAALLNPVKSLRTE